METINYAINDDKGGPITGFVEVLGKGTANNTIQQLSAEIATIFMRTRNQELSIDAKYNDTKMMIIIECRPYLVDDGYMAFSEYIKEMVGLLVTSMHRKAGEII